MTINIRRALAITSIAALAFAAVPTLGVTPAAAAHAHHHRAPAYSIQSDDDFGPGYAATPGYGHSGYGCTEDEGYGRTQPCDGGY
jgi:hypothetical protein